MKWTFGCVRDREGTRFESFMSMLLVVSIEAFQALIKQTTDSFSLVPNFAQLTVIT